MTDCTLLDCTLRDGGYYNAWDFSPELIQAYLDAMKAAQVDIVEIGFRSLHNKGFKGPNAFATDEFIRSLVLPDGLTIGVMLNGAEMLTDLGLEPALERLFPEQATTSPVELVRFACHYREIRGVLPAARWLADRGYKVGINLMQVSERSRDEVLDYAREAGKWPVSVLYFADSMGSMTPEDVARVICWMREAWDGPIGVHAHDNMGLGLQNTLRAQAEGASWLDSTVTGMGRGPGNARTEELVIEAEALRNRRANFVPLMALIRKHFRPMKQRCGWGTNPYYYLSGKYGIHPTYVQEMLADTRYDEEDILAVIERLRHEGGNKFNADRMHGARNFYGEAPRGTWSPASLISGRDVLILGSGPGVAAHRRALEAYIRREKPLVLALNTQSAIAPDLINLRAACHPVRVMADCETYATLPQPLIAPMSMLPVDLKMALKGRDVLDFGLGVQPGVFAFFDTCCIAPTSLVLAYALAIAASGKARQILMAGFDGYPAGDPRNDEVENLLSQIRDVAGTPKIISVTPSQYRNMGAISIYGI
ncbi:aldolase catalytic domain-containing protein [Methylocystis sp. S23]